MILDRDGTVTTECGYVLRRRDLEVMEGVEEALQRARRAGWVLALVTNQSAVGRGLLDPDELDAMHDILMERLGLDAVYYCPHLPEAGCSCRKPSPGLVELAIEELELDRATSVMVGDNLTDVLAGQAAGLRTFLVQSGHGRRDTAAAARTGTRVLDDVAGVVDLLLSERSGG